MTCPDLIAQDPAHPLDAASGVSEMSEPRTRREIEAYEEGVRIAKRSAAAFRDALRAAPALPARANLHRLDKPSPSSRCDATAGDGLRKSEGGS